MIIVDDLHSLMADSRLYFGNGPGQITCRLHLDSLPVPVPVSLQFVSCLSRQRRAPSSSLGLAATYPLDLVRARLSIATANMAVRAPSMASTSAPALALGGARSIASSAFSTEDAKLGMIGMAKKVYATEGGIRGL